MTFDSGHMRSLFVRLQTIFHKITAHVKLMRTVKDWRYSYIAASSITVSNNLCAGQRTERESLPTPFDLLEGNWSQENPLQEGQEHRTLSKRFSCHSHVAKIQINWGNWYIMPLQKLARLLYWHWQFRRQVSGLGQLAGVAKRAHSWAELQSSG